MSSRTARPRRIALAVALALATTPGAFAQSTTGGIFGQVPTATGQTVVITSDTGLSREVAVDERGRYSAGQLPLGTYTVSLRAGGQTVDTRNNIVLKVGAGTEVSFVSSAKEAQDLSGMTVSASALAKIDVSSIDSRTVVTSEQLAKLPLGRSSEAIALLAPGVVNNGGNFKGATGHSLVSFGGSAASENAYYVNGFATTDPLQGFGGLSLPYGAIDQQEVYTGGYSAQYGRSDGGVINVVGKRGTNEWHFGAQVLWEPSFARANQRNRYFENGLPASPRAGNLYAPDSENGSDSTTVSAYAGGPLIKDKLFVFVAAEYQRQEGNTVNPVSGYTSTKPYEDYRYNSPRWYGKIDWNITDSHILELTGASDKYQTSGTVYDYDYASRSRLDRIGADDDTKNGGDLWTAKYTGYITDDLTVSAQYGKLHTTAYDSPGGYNPALTYVDGIVNQNPGLNGGAPRGNAQTVSSLIPAGKGNRTTNTRIDITYKLGDHTITAGIDNQTATALDQGSVTSGPGYSWTYGQGDPNTPISTGLGVPATGGFPNGAGGYYVIQNINSSLATVRSTQRAQYIEDKWQVNDRWLLSLGIRNDQFENFNADSQAFITQHKPQWAPRLGASWDVNGDATFKVYANAGRYYLGLPLNPALNAAGGALTTSQYFTYGGIAADGTPTGLTAISVPVAANNTFGQLPDPKTVTSKGLKSEYQDEFILGFTKTLGSDWVYGAKATQRILRNAIDDYCDIDLVLAKAQSLGYNVTTDSNPVSCWLFNPGKANTFNLVDTAGNYVSVPLSNKEFGFQGLKRRYYGLETFLEHPFNDGWYGKVSYTFSRSYGNTEGQLRSDLFRESRGTGQTAVSTTQDWDNSYIMVNTNGVQNNDHKHQLKFFGYYQFTPEWLVSANLSLISGAPKPCLGYFGEDRTDPAGYGNSYHFCNGEPSPPGSHGRLPWIRQLDLGGTYRPAFASDRLAFNLNVFNVTNEQKVLAIFPNAESSPNLANPLYGTPTAMQQPRYVRLSVNYDY
ncbi:MAG TPA: TonB-dependent receptor [Luteibacter sp.]|jgi:outer membrane receptor for ferrienterochelin and colicin|uniref:TonB-dependent receptor n=1 Tax=Luteibacter sp. TaxID=1886636 RepID=UPI002F418404